MFALSVLGVSIWWSWDWEKGKALSPDGFHCGWDLLVTCDRFSGLLTTVTRINNNSSGRGAIAEVEHGKARILFDDGQVFWLSEKTTRNPWFGKWARRVGFLEQTGYPTTIMFHV